MRRHLHLGGVLTAPQANGLTATEHYHRIGRLLERGKFDFVFIAEEPTLDPSIVAASIGAVTSKLGVAITKSATYLHPHELARIFASLDLVTNGRVGWNIETSPTRGAAPSGHDYRYERAEEFVLAALELLRDAETSPSPQGHPVLIQTSSADTDSDIDFASRWAETIVQIDPTPEGRRAYYDDVKSRAERFGRDPDGVLIFPAFVPFVGTAGQVADQIEESFTAGEADGFLVCPAHTGSTFSHFVDGVVPELQRRGLFRTEYDGSTLREHLGLATNAAWTRSDGVVSVAS